MKISILVTGAAWKPLGGLKIIYEYANRLAQEGHQIKIYYSSCSDFGQGNLFLKIKAIIKYLYFLFLDDFTCKRWFKLHDSIEEIWLWKLTQNKIGTSDRYVATTVQSAYFLNKFNVPTNLKYYFIQGFENWCYGMTDQRVYDSYHFPMTKIVISQWLYQKVTSVNESAYIVYNGFDIRQFKVLNSIGKRDKYQVCMMYNVKFSKGSQDCIEALNEVKKKYPELKVLVFGIPPRPHGLPDWYSYIQQPNKDTLVKMYNKASVFVGASHSEGWGLTIGEAMLCGCAVACTDNFGYLEMAKHNVTALVSPIKDPEKLVDNIIKLINDDNLRRKIAIQGQEFVSSGLRLETSYEQFKKILIC